VENIITYILNKSIHLNNIRDDNVLVLIEETDHAGYMAASGMQLVKTRATGPQPYTSKGYLLKQPAEETNENLLA